MAGVNRVILIGNLGSDPEMRYLEGDRVVARFNIATSERYKNRQGETIEQTEWHRIELWDNLAKIAEKYLKKGNSVYIEGKLRTEEWQDKEGHNRTTVRVRGTSLTLLGGSGQPSNGTDTTTGNTEPSGTPEKPASVPATPTPFDSNAGTDPDDLPF